MTVPDSPLPATLPFLARGGQESGTARSTPPWVESPGALFPGDAGTWSVPLEMGDVLSACRDAREPLLVLGSSVPSPELGPLPIRGQVGLLARMVGEPRPGAGGLRVVLQVLHRFRIESQNPDGTVTGHTLAEMDVPRVDAIHVRTILERVRALGELDAAFDTELETLISLAPTDLARFTDLVGSVLPLSSDDKESLIVEPDSQARLELLTRMLDRKLARIRAEQAVDARVAERLQREDLRERFEALRDELHEPTAHERHVDRLERQIHDTPLSGAARRAAMHELEQFRRAAPVSPEAGRTRNYLEWMLELPWPDPTPRANLEEERAERVTSALETSHVGLGDVKQRISEFLAVRQLGGGARGTVLCFVGPPGTGKSSVGRTIAAALERQFVSIPVGAMLHERDLNGTTHRLEGGMPGAILTGIHRAGIHNPVILLDEIDKLSLGGEGTSAGPLLHLLDPDHNAEFLDHYLGVPFDVSRCLFLATANDCEEIPEALLDRMEVIEFNGYTDSEKYRIARDHLIPRARTQAGLSSEQFQLTPAALRTTIKRYTEEAGVRQLLQQLTSLARKSAVRVVHGEEGLSVKKADLVRLLGPRTVDEELRLRRPAVGVATGLAWTSAGGALLPIETLAMAGEGRVILTGQVGEILRESVQTAISFLRTCFTAFELDRDLLNKLDLHLHFPSAATPKDGPSAGVAIATALASLLTQRPSRHNLAMTGEISLLGAVLPVGGVREKLLAALRSNVDEVILPARNGEEILRLPPEIKNGLTIHLVNHVQEVLELALLPAASPAKGSPLPANKRKRVAKPSSKRRRRTG